MSTNAGEPSSTPGNARLPAASSPSAAPPGAGGKEIGDAGRRGINPAGFQLLQESEGCRLEAYPDPATGGDPWTIGYGHTGPDVKPGLMISQDQANDLLLADLRQFEEGVARLLGDTPVTSNQFSALVVFAFNVGLGALAASTLLKRVREGDMTAAADQFLRWTKAAGKVMPGLVKRRDAERKLFLA